HKQNINKLRSCDVFFQSCAGSCSSSGKSLSKTLSGELHTDQIKHIIECLQLTRVHHVKSNVTIFIYVYILYLMMNCVFCRHLKQNKRSEELLEQYRCEIQELKLKHRKQRMKFENQLHQLIEQHKNLHSVFTPEMLPDEIESAENITRQLLSAEQMKLAQLHRLYEELDEIEKAACDTAAEIQE
uniref:Uncharacterized protein n=1 Tax=Cyclopterus lumpus TaxID=8103 RepID=A0A8C2WDR5_CYCLU